MNLRIGYNKPLKGTITPVSSKSISNRALIIDALTGFSCKLKNLSASEDTQVLKKLLRQYKTADGAMELDAGMAGTVMRFLATFCCLGDKEVLLTGNERMLQRPMRELVEALQNLGASITYAGSEGYAPLLIKPSKLKGGKIQIDAGVSSQFITSLLLCAPYFENGLELELTGSPVSYSYVELTRQLMLYFGAGVQVNNKVISVQKKPYRPQAYTIEGDWSSAAYFYAWASLSENCEIGLKNMNVHSLQGDKAIIDWAHRFGVETIMTNDGIVIRRQKTEVPKVFNEDFLLCPDLAQTVAVMCAGNGLEETRLSGLLTLSGKETDRITALETELKRFGVSFYCMERDLLSFDARGFHGSGQMVRTWNDHRMALSFAPLAQKTGTIVIEDAQVVQKSYPSYWNDLKTLGCLVENSDI